MLRNTSTRWGVVAQTLHWGGAALVFYLLLHGWWMAQWVPPHERYEHASSHTAVGYFVLALIVLRMAWRWSGNAPAHPANAPSWERITAQVVQVSLYVVLLIECYLGWALAGTFKQPLDRTLFGIAKVPPLSKPGNRDAHQALAAAHEYFAWVMAALIVVHVAIAIYHWKIRRDDVLQRMLPG